MPFDLDHAASDEELLAGYAKGQAAAARALTLRFTPRVFAHAMRVLGDRALAEDVAQDAMLRLWKMAPDWRAGEAQVSTWLYRVTANLCTDHLRKRRGDGPALDEIAEPEDDQPNPDEVLQQQARGDALQEALMALPERQRQAVVLRHFGELSNPEIAEVLDISVDAVESLTARGKRALAKILAPQKEALGYDNA